MGSAFRVCVPTVFPSLCVWPESAVYMHGWLLMCFCPCWYMCRHTASTGLYVPLMLMGGWSGYLQPSLCMCVCQSVVLLLREVCHLFALGPQRTIGCQGLAQRSRWKRQRGVEQGIEATIRRRRGRFLFILRVIFPTLQKNLLINL